MATQRMTKVKTNKILRILQEKRNKIMKRINSLEEKAKTLKDKDYGNHLADSDSEELGRMNGTRLLRLQKQLRDFEEAIERVRTGEYGICVICEEPISKDRLQIKPEARLCVKCKKATESHLRKRTPYTTQVRA